VASSWRRSIVEAPLPANNSLVLAAGRTRRSDPVGKLTMYEGGWNISDTHYWAVRTANSIQFLSSPLKKFLH
jgi:hypothetical protein